MPKVNFDHETRILDTSLQPKSVEVKNWPKIGSGVCEECGIVDTNVPSWDQWKHCKHYAHLKEEMRCLYCPPGQDPSDWFKGRTLTVLERRDKPAKLLVHCDDIRCVNKFYSTFRA